MRWLAAFLVSLSLVPAALADSEDDALALTLELINQIAEVGGLTVDTPNILTTRLEAAIEEFDQEAEARDVDWAMSYRVDANASNVAYHDAEGIPLPIAPETLEERDRMPAPRTDCDMPVSHPVSAASTALASWEVCTGIEDDGDGPYYFGSSELLYGEDGNFKRLRLAIAITSSDESYINTVSGPATQLLYAMMDAVRADAIAL